MKNPLFNDFDYSVLNESHYKEDAVREDIVAPILKKLGYTPSGPNRMIRSKALIHPFVHIGTKVSKVNIIPDYLLEVNGQPVFILDAKAPNQNIRNGHNIEQAFSYAIHPEVRTFRYGLCNGRELSLFIVTKLEPHLVIPIEKIDERWEEIYNLISPLALTTPKRLGFLPDYGLTLIQLGMPEATQLKFVHMCITFISKISDDLYTIVTSVGPFNDVAYAISFDFERELFQRFIDCVPSKLKDTIVSMLKQQPYQAHLKDDSGFFLTIRARQSGEVIKHNGDEYSPFIVSEFITE